MDRKSEKVKLQTGGLKRKADHPTYSVCAKHIKTDESTAQINGDDEVQKILKKNEFDAIEEKISIKLSVINRNHGVRFGKMKFEDYLEYLEKKFPVPIMQLNEKLKDSL